MALYDNYPYSNFHALNLDWIIGEMKKVVEDWEEFQSQFGTVTAEAHTGSPINVETTGDFQTGVNFDFTIPAGETGPQGPQGPQGAQGPKGNSNVWTGSATLSSGTIMVNTDTLDFVGDDQSVIFVRFNDSIPANTNSYPVVIDSTDPHYLSTSFDSLNALTTEIPAGSILALSYTGGSYYTLLNDFIGEASLPDSGVNAGTYGQYTTTSGNLNVPQITVNSKGIITSASSLSVGYITRYATTTIAAGNTTGNIYVSSLTTPYRFNVLLYRTSDELSGGYSLVDPSTYQVDFTSTRVMVTLDAAVTDRITYVVLWGTFTSTAH